jgi:hypothetical protein
MKKTLFITFCWVYFLLNAQVTVSGKVLDERGIPVQAASVYLNNTTIGTNSDADGYFSLYAEHGYYTLVVSHVGFETTNYSLNTLELPDEIVFQLFEKNNQLDEIVMKQKRKSGKRAFFLSQFRRNFLGISAVAEKTRIKNEDAILFEYDEVNEILEATTTEPLVLENKGLGYKITYDLIHFELQPRGVTYLGYTRYERLQGTMRKIKKWQTEREIAYNGSFRHFLTAAIQQDSLAGFEVDLVKLIPNPDYPTEEQVFEAEEIVRKHGGLQRNPFQNDPQLDRKVKLANEILRKAEEFNEFIEVPIKRKMRFEDYFEKDEEGMYLFSEYPDLRIKYKNEYQERNYKSPDETYTSKNHQVSRIKLYDERVLVNSMGLLHNPLDVLLEGYWAFEKVADKVPLDYKPKGNLHR